MSRKTNILKTSEKKILKMDSDKVEDEDSYSNSAIIQKEQESYFMSFSNWNANVQVNFVKQLLTRMYYYQLGHVNAFIKPMLQRDFITLLPEKGLEHIAENILSYLDSNSLKSSELVCKEWRNVICEGMLWKKLIENKVRTNSLWRGMVERRGWIQYLFKPREGTTPRSHIFYRELFEKIVIAIENTEKNWKRGHHCFKRIDCFSRISKGVYCLQYDDAKIVSGMRDNVIKIWNCSDLQCGKTLSGHSGSVLCLQYDDKILISGSSDTTVRVWDVNTGELINVLRHHVNAVLHLRFNNSMMVTCSKDHSIAVWYISTPSYIKLRHTMDHRAAVNVIDFDHKYIVSGSGDRTIKIWSTSTFKLIRTLNGHQRGIACLQYRDRLIVSGSGDNSIRLWDIESGTCLRILEGHEDLVRCIRFDSKRIVSGDYDGKIKVWDMAAALDPHSNLNSLCLNTFMKHDSRVYHLQFDEFQIVSSSHDDTISILDFSSENIRNKERKQRANKF